MHQAIWSSPAVPVSIFAFPGFGLSQIPQVQSRTHASSLYFSSTRPGFLNTHKNSTTRIVEGWRSGSPIVMPLTHLACGIAWHLQHGQVPCYYSHLLLRRPGPCADDACSSPASPCAPRPMHPSTPSMPRAPPANRVHERGFGACQCCCEHAHMSVDGSTGPAFLCEVACCCVPFELPRPPPYPPESRSGNLHAQLHVCMCPSQQALESRSGRQLPWLSRTAEHLSPCSLPFVCVVDTQALLFCL